jgi:D-galactarolactone cycloisomerase
MKIARIDTYVLKAPLAGGQRFYSSQAAFPERTSMLVRVTTEDGIVGWGEGGQYGPSAPPAAIIRDVLAPRLIGRPADQPVRLLEEGYAFSRDFGQKGAYIEALSALDIALWDITGQALGRPVHALMGGGFRDRVKAYATGCYYPEHYADHDRMIATLCAEVEGYRELGFEALKVKIGLLPVAADTERLEIVREAVGPRTGIMVDANHAYNAATAIRIGRVLERLDVLWLEEPVVPEDRAGYRRVREALGVPIAGGECEFTRFGFRDLIGEGCIDIAQPDLCACGGFTEWQKIQALALAYGVLTIPHVWGSGIAVAAALHALATVPPTPHTAAPVILQNEPMVEFDRTHNPLRDDLLTERFRLEDGALLVPQGPGLGVTVDEEVLGRYAVA